MTLATQRASFIAGLAHMVRIVRVIATHARLLLARATRIAAAPASCAAFFWREIFPVAGGGPPAADVLTLSSSR